MWRDLEFALPNLLEPEVNNDVMWTAILSCLSLSFVWVRKYHWHNAIQSNVHAQSASWSTWQSARARADIGSLHTKRCRAGRCPHVIVHMGWGGVGGWGWGWGGVITSFPREHWNSNISSAISSTCPLMTNHINNQSLTLRTSQSVFLFRRPRGSHLIFFLAPLPRAASIYHSTPLNIAWRLQLLGSASQTCDRFSAKPQSK